MSNKDNQPIHIDLPDIDREIDDMVEQFRSSRPDDDVQIIEPIATGTADALTAAPVSKPAPAEEPLPEGTVDEPAHTDDIPEKPARRNRFMRFIGAIVPHVGDNAFDVIRKCIMIVGILVFVGAATYLVDDLILIPMQNTVLAESLQSQYSPSTPPELSAEEQNYPYPAGIDESFKKLYYLNNDVRGWINYISTDGGATVSADYPIMQADDNDFYLFHDFNKTYNKNGTLFFDYRNKIESAADTNKNTIIYGHNMASGQMFAALNNLLDGVDYARVAPTFTMNTLFEQNQYKVFAVMVVNNDPNDGLPFSYLRTDFADNVDFATFVSEIMARSLYVYGDVDVRPDDEIVSLSTCTSYGDVHFNDGRTVVVARKVRDGEDPSTDVSKITYNDDVLMPYAWYTNQKLEPHPYYTNANYVIQPLDSLMSYLATSTAPANQPTTTFTLFEQNGTFGLVNPVTTLPTTSLPTVPTTTVPTAAFLQSFYIQSTPAQYNMGDSFNYDQTYIVGTYSDGLRVTINPYHCAVTGFDSSRPGSCYVTLHYGNLSASFYVNIVGSAPTAGTTAAVPTTTVTTTEATTEPTTTTTFAYIPPEDLTPPTDGIPGDTLTE